MSKEVDNKVTREKNAEIVVNALKFLHCSTLNDIVNYVAASYDEDPESIRESVKLILQKGVKYGYVQKDGLKYSIDSGLSSGESEGQIETLRKSVRLGKRKRPKRRKSRSRSRSRRRGRGK